MRLRASLDACFLASPLAERIGIARALGVVFLATVLARRCGLVVLAVSVVFALRNIGARVAVDACLVAVGALPLAHWVRVAGLLRIDQQAIRRARATDLVELARFVLLATVGIRVPSGACRLALAVRAVTAVRVLGTLIQRKKVARLLACLRPLVKAALLLFCALLAVRGAVLAQGLARRRTSTGGVLAHVIRCAFTFFLELLARLPAFGLVGVPHALIVVGAIALAIDLVAARFARATHLWVPHAVKKILASRFARRPQLAFLDTLVRCRIVLAIGLAIARRQVWDFLAGLLAHANIRVPHACLVSLAVIHVRVLGEASLRACARLVQLAQCVLAAKYL